MTYTQPRHRTRPELCASQGHPLVTYNPNHDVSACLCGARWGDGDQAIHGVACCGGPLTEEIA